MSRHRQLAPSDPSHIVRGAALASDIPLEKSAALELKLTDDEAAALEKPYRNHGPSWY